MTMKSFKEEFIDRYPLLFPEDKRTYRSFGCGQGWWPLLHAAFEKITKIVMSYNEDERDINIDCVKEKFGGLRIYINDENDIENRKEQIFVIVSETENKSYKTCEFCGAPGSLRKGTWLKVRCAECQTEHENKQKVER